MKNYDEMVSSLLKRREEYVHHVQRIWTRPLFVKWGKHHCPSCGSDLTKIEVSKIVNSKSEEAKDFDFSSGNTYMIGNVKFIWTEFFCASCNQNYSVNEIYLAEKRAKKSKR